LVNLVVHLQGLNYVRASAVVSALAFAMLPALTLARTVPNWSFDELFEKSDLVLIVTRLGTWDTPAERDKAPFDRPEDAEMLTPVFSALTVHSVIKGEYAEKEFILNHHRLDQARYGPRDIGNGPNLIVFTTDSAPPLKKAEYMLFLKKNDAGMFLPVTGMFDSLYSVKQLVEPKSDF
jgi:hypothetical protein